MSEMPIALTLDTNVIMDWAWCKGIYPGMRYGNDPKKKDEVCALMARLERLQADGMCRLAVVTGLFADYDQVYGELPGYMTTMIEVHLPFATPGSGFPQIFPEAFPEKAPEKIEHIRSLVFPAMLPESKWFVNATKDAQQLFAHYVAGRDLFITSDTDINDHRAELLSAYQIRVSRLGDYLATL